MSGKQNQYADSTLLRMTKYELIQHIRDLESTIECLEFQNDNQYKILMEFNANQIQEAYEKAHRKEGAL